MGVRTAVSVVLVAALGVSTWLYADLRPIGLMLDATWQNAFGAAPKPVPQPLAFPHAVHLAPQRLGLTCETCHQQVFDGPQAGRPPDWVCQSCHPAFDPTPPSAAVQTLLAFAQRGEPVPWRRVWGLAADIRFSHRRHVAVAGIPCEPCHGDVAAETAPLSAPLRVLDMAACIACHETWSGALSPVAAGVAAGGVGAVTTDCTACHR